MGCACGLRLYIAMNGMLENSVTLAVCGVINPADASLVRRFIPWVKV